MTTLAVVASGLVTGLGFNAPATLAALRAGLSGVRETPWKDHVSGDPIKGCRVSLPHWWEGTGKLADLVAPAIHECLLGAPADDIAAIPVLVGVSAPDRPGRPGDLDATLLDGFHNHANADGAKGIGELGICGSGAAVANAVFALTGLRLRALPLRG